MRLRLRFGRFSLPLSLLLAALESSWLTISMRKFPPGFRLRATRLPQLRPRMRLRLVDVSNASPAGGSLGADIKSGIAGDPWSQILPGAYAANSAGSLIGNNLDAKVSTRLPTATYVTPPTAVQNATATRDIDNTNPAANSLGAMVKSAGTAGDPWSTALPGAYGAGTAGKIIGTNIDALISSRLAAATYVVPPTAAQNTVAVRDVEQRQSSCGYSWRGREEWKRGSVGGRGACQLCGGHGGQCAWHQSGREGFDTDGQ